MNVFTIGLHSICQVYLVQNPLQWESVSADMDRLSCMEETIRLKEPQCVKEMVGSSGNCEGKRL